MAVKKKKAKRAKKKVVKKKGSVKKTVKKASKKKSARKKTTAKKKQTAQRKKVPAGRVLGIVTHYFPHVNAAVVKVKKPFAVGDRIVISGTTTNFEQTVESIQIDHAPIQSTKKGDEIGLGVRERVREHDLILLPE